MQFGEMIIQAGGGLIMVAGLADLIGGFSDGRCRAGFVPLGQLGGCQITTMQRRQWREVMEIDRDGGDDGRGARPVDDIADVLQVRLKIFIHGVAARIIKGQALPAHEIHVLRLAFALWPQLAQAGLDQLR